MPKSFSALALSASLAVVAAVSGVAAVPSVAAAQEPITTAQLVTLLDQAVRAAAAEADAAGLSGQAKTDFVLAAIQNAIAASGADPQTAQDAVGTLRRDMPDVNSLGVYFALNAALTSLQGDSGPGFGGSGGGSTGSAPFGGSGSAGGGGGGGSDYRPNT